MADYTFLRVEVESRLVGRVLDALPGVAVVDDLTADEGADDDETDDTRATGGTATASDARPGPAEVETTVEATATDTDEEPSAFREWGLLGVGLAFVVLGLATVGIWWYRRRSDGDGEPETPPPTRPETDVSDSLGRDATGFGGDERAVDRSTADADEESDEDADPDTGASSGPTDATDRDEATARGAEPTTPETKPSEGDETPEGSEAAEPTPDPEATRPDTDIGAPESEFERPDTTSRTVLGEGDDGRADAVEPGDADEDETADAAASEDRGSVDPAPLLGVAFLALTGVVARRLVGRETADR
ncbi:hypothetical protein [Haloarcula litorea]|uniref:hypothetical protein n=1 Tax=Haloarcula litorea TaxID=3032579 RepID=UPI0023E76C44|nr:hypothetical protein [Halomicroarcula sp. GDY20]